MLPIAIISHNLQNVILREKPIEKMWDFPGAPKSMLLVIVAKMWSSLNLNFIAI